MWSGLGTRRAEHIVEAVNEALASLAGRLAGTR
jgi:hypothetical protein